MAKKLQIKKKEAGRRSKLKEDRENRLRSKLKKTQKKKLNDELFTIVTLQNIDQLDKASKKKTMMELYKLISSFPEENHGKIELLLIFLQDNDIKIILKSLKMITHLFLDILPSYKIWEDDNSSTKKSKEVDSLQSFEKSLLKYYQKFIKMLDILSRNFHVKSDATKNLQMLTIQAVSKLFEKFFHFNYSELLYKILIERLTDHSPEIKQKSFMSLYKVLSIKDNNSHFLELKLKIIKLISHAIFIKPHSKFNDDVLDLFTAHKIEFPDFSEYNQEKFDMKGIKDGKRGAVYDTDEKHKTKQESRLEKKDKKQLMKDKDKIIKTMKREMQEFQNVENPKAIYYINLKILKKILLVFLDILKYKKESNLIRSVLSGIGIMCECINIEILIDLQKCIYDYINWVLNDKNNPKKIFTISALKANLNITEKLTKDIISIEDTNLINSTYLFLSSMTEESISGKLTKDDLFNLFELIDFLVLKNRQYSLDVVASFLKRIALYTVTLCDVNKEIVAAFLLFIKRIIQKYPNLNTMLDQEDSNIDMFNYKIKNDPTLCNGKQSSIVQELKQIRTKIQKQAIKEINDKVVLKILDYVLNNEKNNSQFSSLSFYDLLVK